MRLKILSETTESVPDKSDVLVDVYNTAKDKLKNFTAQGNVVALLIQKAVKLMRNSAELDGVISSDRKKLLEKRWTSYSNVALGIQSGDLIKRIPADISWVQSDQLEKYPEELWVVKIRDEHVICLDQNNNTYTKHITIGDKVIFVKNRTLPEGVK